MTSLPPTPPSPSRGEGDQSEFPKAAARFDARIFLLALGTFAIGTDVFVIAGILKPIAADVAVSVEAAGQMVTAYALTYALGSPILAGITAHWRRERLIVMALAGFACADAVCALTSDFTVLIVARIAAGSCAALYAPTAYTMAAAMAAPERRGVALATVALGMTSATVFGAPLGTWLGTALGWHATFVLGAVLAALAAGALKLGRIPPVSAAPRLRLTALFRPIAQPEVLLSLLANLLWSAGNYTIYHYSAVLFGERLGLDNIAWLLLGYGLGGLAGSQLGGRLVDRFGTTAPIIVCVAVNAANIGLINLTGGSALGAAAALFGMGFAGWAVFPAQQSRMLRLAPDHGGVALSLISSTIYLGSALGAALGGVLLARVSTTAPPYAASAAILFGLALFLLGNRRRDRVD